LQAHQPSFETGSVNLDGEFIPRESKVEEQVSTVQVSGEQSPEERGPEEQSPEEQSSEEQSSEKEITPLLE
jgi:hypothetical protein